MSIIFNDAYPEPSSKVGFSNNILIRDAENRDDTCLPNALKDANVGVYLICDTQVVLKGENQALFTLDEANKFAPDMVDAVLLGQGENGPRIGASVKADPENMPDGYSLVGLRNLLFIDSMDKGDVGAIAQANSILHWHKVNQYCGKCGTKSTPRIGGYRRDCPSCEHMIFPRTDPVVIMLSIKDGPDGQKALLGRSPHFPEGMYSTLAGFVEPGETIEDAVRRETFEESGIEIGQVKYFASQPWPFQSSLMIGVHCQALNSTINMDESELEDCRWFTRAEIATMIRDEHPEGIKCPPSKAIAFALIDEWASS